VLLKLMSLNFGTLMPMCSSS